MRPAVLVDASAIPQNLGGVGRYLERLVAALDQLGEFRLHIAVKPAAAAHFRAVAPNSTIHPLPHYASSRPIRLLWEQFGLPLLARRVRVSAILSPHYTMPLMAAVPVVTTFHDATFFSDPQVHGRFKRIFFTSWMRLSARRAHWCITPSESARSEISKYVPLVAAKSTAVHHGVDSATFHVPDSRELSVATELAGTKNWLVFLGTVEPRKNLPELVRAFELTLNAVGQRFADLTLVIAGSAGWDHEVDSVIEGCGLRERVRRVGYVDPKVLPGLLGGSLAFCYPSLGEGFGLPVLEAMACGAVVVTTRRLALPEVGGDCVIYSGTDSSSISDALVTALVHQPMREDLSARSIKRAGTFTWDRAARAHTKILLEAMA